MKEQKNARDAKQMEEVDQGVLPLTFRFSVAFISVSEALSAGVRPGERGLARGAFDRGKHPRISRLNRTNVVGWGPEIRIGFLYKLEHPSEFNTLGSAHHV